MAEALKISVIIPTRNGALTLPALLEKLASQTISVDELLIVDSQSTDETVQIAQKINAQLVQIQQAEFDHGATRTMMAKRAKGDLLIFFTQDAIPLASDCIEKLIAPFRGNENLCISYGRQLPNPNASLFAAALRDFNYPGHSVVRTFSDRSKLGLKTVFVSNSCSCYKKSILAEIGYFPDSLIFGEDTCAAGRLLKKGYSMAYVAEAAVYHSHNYSLIQEFQRSFDIGVLHRSERWLPETYGRAEGEGMRYVKFELARILKAKRFFLLPLFFLRNCAKLIGYKLGSRYHVLPRRVLPKLSMHSGWWSRSDTAAK